MSWGSGQPPWQLRPISSARHKVRQQRGGHRKGSETEWNISRRYIHIHAFICLFFLLLVCGSESRNVAPFTPFWFGVEDFNCSGKESTAGSKRDCRWGCHQELEGQVRGNARQPESNKTDKWHQDTQKLGSTPPSSSLNICSHKRTSPAPSAPEKKKKKKSPTLP